jgi:hypothetical protein
VLAKILAKTAVDEATRDSVSSALKSLGYKIASTDSSEEDGVTTSFLAAESAAASVTVVSFDWRTAKQDGRIALDGARMINVQVCKDCTARTKKTLSQAWQNAKARVLLGKLTNA